MLSACNFLAKAHSFLVKPEAFVTADDRAKVTAAKKTVEQHRSELSSELKPLFKSSKTNWIPPKIGSCNETEAFGRFIEALQRDGVDLGLPTDKARAVWDQFRNELAHMADTKGVVEVCVTNEGKPPNDARDAIRSCPAFRMKDGRWVCNADRLSLDVLEIAEWLCNEVNSCVKQNRITSLAEWMFEDTELTPSHEPDVHNHRH